MKTAKTVQRAFSEAGTLPANKLANVRRRARRALHHTCPASRHVLLLADTLAAGHLPPMIVEDPRHVAGSLYAVIESLGKLRQANPGGAEVPLCPK